LQSLVFVLHVSVYGICVPSFTCLLLCNGLILLYNRLQCAHLLAYLEQLQFEQLNHFLFIFEHLSVFFLVVPDLLIILFKGDRILGTILDLASFVQLNPIGNIAVDSFRFLLLYDSFLVDAPQHFESFGYDVLVLFIFGIDGELGIGHGTHHTQNLGLHLLVLFIDRFEFLYELLLLGEFLPERFIDHRLLYYLFTYLLGVIIIIFVICHICHICKYYCH
jgi:hypothetical protein